VSWKVKVFGIQATSLSLDEQVRAAVTTLQVRRAQEGELLACSLCGRVVDFTYRTVCGRCFLAGKEGRSS
jgi:hypothetical protein